MAGTVDELTVRDDGSYAIYVRPTTYSVTKTLAADTAEYITVPSGANYVLFSSNVAFMARYNETAAGTAAAAFGDATPDACHELSPTVRQIRGVGEISVIAKAACELSALFFK